MPTIEEEKLLKEKEVLLECLSKYRNGVRELLIIEDRIKRELVRDITQKQMCFEEIKLLREQIEELENSLIKSSREKNSITNTLESFLKMNFKQRLIFLFTKVAKN